jgi:D-arabinose 1-dehydrogenase-like Zn-dependent alcohol dehydrogenase
LSTINAAAALAAVVVWTLEAVFYTTAVVSLLSIPPLGQQLATTPADGYSEYGPSEVLRFENVEKPAAKDGDLLVRVRASSVNQWDWDLVRGKPLLVRLGGVRRPQHRILGADNAGIVEAVGGNMTRFQPGDEAFGDISGCG